jgi:ATP-dependent DNA ligase
VTDPRSLPSPPIGEDGGALPVMPPVKPMLARSVPNVPEGEYLYEPKWVGFRRG